MRIAKKGLSLLLVLAMLAVTVCIPAAAADPVAVTATSDKNMVLQGDEITITVKVGAVENIAVINSRLYYDPEKLEYVDGSIKKGALSEQFAGMNSVTCETGVEYGELPYIVGLHAIDDEGINNDAESALYSATFKVLVDSGDIAPELVVNKFNDGDLVAIDYIPVQATVTAARAPIVSVEASASEKSNVTASLEGTTIVVSGMVDADDKTVTVTYTAVEGIDGGEITLQKKEDGEFDNTTVVVGGITYTVDASGLVTKPEVTITPKTASVEVGKTTKLTAEVKNAEYATVSWESSDGEIATVLDDGTVEGVSEGKATITVMITVDGKEYTDTCTVTVTKAGGGEETGNCTVTIEGGEHATVKNGDDVIGDTIDTSSDVALTIAPADGYKLDSVKYTIGEDGTETDGEVTAEGTCTITVPAGGTVVSITITATPTQSGEGVTVTGTITSYEIMVGGEPLSGEVTLELSDGTDTKTQTVSDGSFSFADVSTGTYTLTVSKAGHVTREYEVEVGSTEVTQDVKINPLGDVTDDGLVDMDDVICLVRYAKNSERYSLGAAYWCDCGDVNGDGKTNAKDCTKIARYVKNPHKYQIYNVEG